MHGLVAGTAQVKFVWAHEADFFEILVLGKVNGLNAESIARQHHAAAVAGLTTARRAWR
jgi:hypothetical protein